MNIPEWAVCAPYLGEKCPVCGREFATPDDIKDAVFGLDTPRAKLGVNAPDVVCKSCWNEYSYKLVTRYRDFVEMVWNRLERGQGQHGYVAVLTDKEIDSIRSAVRFATNESAE